MDEKNEITNSHQHLNSSYQYISTSRPITEVFREYEKTKSYKSVMKNSITQLNFMNTRGSLNFKYNLILFSLLLQFVISMIMLKKIYTNQRNIEVGLIFMVVTRTYFGT